ncbi:hypothetical protein DPMN_122519 [Dreissena polymorpha]|uniref:BTB domain-containing protein n=1 Tax=Dreissena polymorpha TaxID=45954 RepID=A0A9D4GSM7_DREPO|nr:hypothetical protein DPMN_122519 [Dreissena polymorpha]
MHVYLPFLLYPCSDLSQPAVPKSSLKKKHRVFDVDDASGLIPSDIFYLNTDHVLQRCETFDQLSELLVNAALSSPATDSSDFLNKCKRILKVPVDTLDHYGSIGTFLATLYENKHLIDVVIDVRGTLFGAHRIALSCQSDFFADMFSKSTGRRIPFEFKIKGVSPEAFACFLEFCYTGKLTIMPSIAADILIVADVLRVMKQNYSYFKRIYLFWCTSPFIPCSNIKAIHGFVSKLLYTEYARNDKRHLFQVIVSCSQSIR